MATSPIICHQCEKTVYLWNGHINRARKIGAPIYCGRVCAGLVRRKNKTIEQKKEEKRLYDIEYRANNIDTLKAKKAAYYQRTHNPVREAASRKKRMHLHVEYCRRPAYRVKKKIYDRAYRCKKFFGPYWEAASALFDLENEINSRISRYEIYQQNGILNKHLNRRREYERLISG